MKLWIGVLLLIACPPLFATALVVSASQGTSKDVPWDYTGNGNGFGMGVFEINNPHTAGLVLYGITLTANQSGDDSTGFSEIGLFIDIDNSGTYGPGADVRYGAAYTAYPVDDGNLTFTSSVGFAPGETRRFIIVGKLDGAVPPAFGDSFQTIVSSISATGGTPTGLPTTFIRGAYVVSAPTPLTLEYDVTGSGSPYAYSFRLVLDNHDGSWASGQEWSFVNFGQAAFGNGGTTPFAGWSTNAASYPIGPYYATGWSNYSVGAISYDSPILIPPQGTGWTPAFVGDQLVWWGTANVFLDEGQMGWSSARTLGGPTIPGSATLEPARRVGDYLRVVAVPGALVDVGSTATGGGNGFAVGAFDVVGHTNAATLSSITMDASGTGNDSTAFSDIRLFVDSNTNGVYDAGTDAQFGGAFTAYPADNGGLTFNGTLNFNPNETKRLLVVAKLNGPTLATFGQTFNTTVTAISATGNMHSGLPTAVMPGIHIHAPTLTLTTSSAPQSVLPNAQGPGGSGLEVAEYLLSNNSVGTANLDSITVAAAGAMFDQTDFSYVALYQDTNLSGGYDAGDASVAPTVTAFPGDDGELTFAQAISFAPGQSRRFFLVVRLSGWAQQDADFWAQISALGVSGGTETFGVPGELVQGANILPGQPAINVQRGVAIANGGTDVLGSGSAGSVRSVTYTIQNTGSGVLTLGGTPNVTAGANVTSVSVTTAPALAINAGGSTTFVVEYTVTVAGAFDFGVSIDSDDPVNDPHTWTATGTANSSGGGDGDGGGSDDGGCVAGTAGVPVLGLIGLLLLARRRRK